MPRFLDLIRRSALPSHQMMTAAKGALHVPAEEMVEILVYLAENNKIFGEQARMTLAAWDEESSKKIVANPATPKEVLEYWLSPKNLRPSLFTLLLENSAVSLQRLTEITISLKGEWIDAMLANPRIRGSKQLLQELSTNKSLSGVQIARIQELINGDLGLAPAEALQATKCETQAGMNESDPKQTAPTQSSEHAEPDSEATPPSDPETEGAIVAFLQEHAKEIAAEVGKTFQTVAEVQEGPLAKEAQPTAAMAAAASSGTAHPSPSAKTSPKKLTNPQDEQRGSVLQKIAALDVKGRIQLAMKGTKEERSILIRDGTKIVALAVLDSPKITDGEVEKFATQKNVLEAVLRAIPMKRRFAKNYAVVRNLVFNPRTPMDVALGLMKNMLVQDLRNLSGNKEVSDTIRKLALRMFKQKMEASNK